MKNRVFLFLAVVCVPAFADVRLPKLISDGMVLQRDANTTIWGWANPNEKITVNLGQKRFHATAGRDGKWALQMEPMLAGGPYTMTISGHNTITLSDVYFGDVWFCSGQSNMVLTMERVKEKYPDEVAGANNLLIRNFFVPTAADMVKPHDDLPGGKWVPLTKENVLGFGAATFFFAQKIFAKYHVPIGIINSSVGGTPVEAWISQDALQFFPDEQALIHRYQDTAYVNRLLKIVPPVETTAAGSDKGTAGPMAWYDPSFVPKHWHAFWLPGYWEDQGVKGLNGVLWFRKEIDVPASMTGKPAKLFMGRIVDADETYVNGVKVGAITYLYPPRRYELPTGLLKAGRNVIVVRVTNTAGKGGFVPDKPYRLAAGSESIDLRGEWHYQVGQVFSPKEEGKTETPFSAQHAPAALYNAMVAPAIHYTIKGFAWYQGETNTGKPLDYSGLLRALISDWRSKWKLGELPFLYVQLANFMEVQYSPAESNWAVLRNEQRLALVVPRTAMITTIDLGEWNDVHPLNKKDVGERLAAAAINVAYGDHSSEYSGPLYKSVTVENHGLVVSFTHTGSGLVVQGGGDLYYFEIAGADKKFVWAKAQIEGDRVRVWSDQVSFPLYVRYAWANNPEGANLYNREGLPASPFEAEVEP